MSQLIITQRFCGPPRSGNGGYVAGALVAALAEVVTPGAIEVTLRRPPPLEVALTVDGSLEPARTATLRDGDTLVAEARRVDVPIDPVEPVPYDVAVAASASYPGFTFHPFPTCFVCGAERSDGLRIFPGAVSAPGETTQVAAPWTPPDDVDLPTTWAALDCIGGWAGDLTERLMVLGRITAFVDVVPLPGEPHVVMGRTLGTEGRRTVTSSTLYDPDGRIVGGALHLWFAVDPATFNS